MPPKPTDTLPLSNRMDYTAEQDLLRDETLIRHAIYKEFLEAVAKSRDNAETESLIVRMHAAKCEITNGDIQLALKHRTERDQVSILAFLETTTKMKDLAIVRFGHYEAFIDMKLSRMMGKPKLLNEKQLDFLYDNQFTRWVGKFPFAQFSGGLSFDLGILNDGKTFNFWNPDAPFAIQPKSGDACPILDYIRTYLCANDVAVYNKFCMYCANIIQHVKKPKSAYVIANADYLTEKLLLEHGLGRMIGSMYIKCYHDQELGNELIGKLLQVTDLTHSNNMQRIVDARISRQAVQFSWGHCKIDFPCRASHIFFIGPSIAVNEALGKCVILDAKQIDYDEYERIQRWLVGGGTAIWLQFLLDFEPETHGMSWSDLDK